MKRLVVGFAFIVVLATITGLIYTAGVNAERATDLAAQNEAIEAKRDTLLRATVRSRKDAERREAAIAIAKKDADRQIARYRTLRDRVVTDTVEITTTEYEIVSLADSALDAQQGLIVELGATLAWYQVQVAKRDTIIALDSAIIANLERRQAGSRCGRRCGIAIGAGGVLAAVLVTAKFADISRGGR